MGNPILDLLGDVGYAMDTPGAYFRGALSGNLGQRASGAEMRQAWGLPDAGPVADTLAEVVTDPFMLAGAAAGGLGAFRAARSLSRADDVNPLVKAVAGFADQEAGALRPFQEIGRRTDPDFVNAREWFHGSATPGLTPGTLDPMLTDPNGLAGRGVYKTVDPFMSGKYAEARFKTAAGDWGKAATDALRGPGFGDEQAAGLASDFLGSTEFARPQFQNEMGDLLRELQYYRAAQSGVGMLGRPNIPGDLRRLITRVGEYNPEALPAAHSILSARGFAVPPAPAKSVYRAATNHGSILDLDVPADPGVYQAIRAMSESDAAMADFAARKAWAGPMFSQVSPADPLDALMKSGRASNMDIVQEGRFISGLDGSPTTDQLIVALRNAGYDALTHTGGERAGGGKTLHDVLISLDPNDTVSRVGRGNQMRRFDPLDPEAVRSLTGWAQ